MTPSWGYTPPPSTSLVQVPNEMLEAVNALIHDPEGFTAALQQHEETVGRHFVEVNGYWFDPARVVAVTPRDNVIGSRIHLEHGVSLSVDDEPRDVLERIAAKLSDLGERVDQ